MRAELESHGHEVVSVARSPTENAGLVLDLCDRTAVIEAISSLQVDAVVHLAAIAFVAHGDVDQMYRVNVVGTRNLLEALSCSSHPPSAVLIASSANVYGNSDSEIIDECVLPKPANDYAVSKLAMEYMARIWMNRLPIMFVRPFNYTGVGQGASFLIPKIVSHFRMGADEISLGNLDVVREFQDVRDVVAIYRELLNHGRAGETYNICSGVGYSLLEVMQILEGMTGNRLRAIVNPDLVRANEVRKLVGSGSKLESVLPGHPRRPLQETLTWMLSE